MFCRTVLCLAALGCLAFSVHPAAVAAEITGERIFDGVHPRVEKADKALEDSEKAADAELKQAQVRHLRTRVKIFARAVESLAAEEAAAMHAGDSAGVAAVVLRKKEVQTRWEKLREQLEAETGETLPAAKPVERPVGTQPVGSQTVPSAAGPAASATAPAVLAPKVPDSAPAAPAAPVLLADVPTFMLGRWKVSEGDKVIGFVELSSTGQNKVYAAFKANGAREAQGGRWRVSNEGEVTLIGDLGGGAETFRVALSSKAKAAGFRWSRKNESVPYRKGAAVEFAKEGR